MLKKYGLALILGLALVSPALAGDIAVSKAVAHVDEDGANGRHLGIFMVIANAGAVPDRLYAARSKVASKIELATAESKSSHSHDHGHGHGAEPHMTSATFLVPAKGQLSLKDGGMHLMVKNPSGSFRPGSTFTVTLFFENAGRVETTVTIENHT